MGILQELAAQERGTNPLRRAADEANDAFWAAQKAVREAAGEQLAQAIKDLHTATTRRYGALRDYYASLPELRPVVTEAPETDGLPRCHYCGQSITGRALVGVFGEYQCEQCQ